MKFFLTILSLFIFYAVQAQNVDNIISEGNDSYKKGAYKNAAELYKKALEKDEKNNTAKFNLGNALQKQNDATNAEKYYDEVAASVNDALLKAKAFYNRGVAQVQQQKLADAIESFKEALKLIPEDNDTRENLQKAINDLKKQQQSLSQQQQKNQQKPRQKPKNKLTNQEMIDQKFNELRDKEKQLQKMLQRKPNAAQPEKDW
ncbi:MAG TPA: tetratricopeptide repeat protein [Chitinophagaceae bacterium]|nr:tetratricopeptide repeat protein [Chitinophagaceae bacterium]